MKRQEAKLLSLLLVGDKKRIYIVIVAKHYFNFVLFHLMNELQKNPKITLVVMNC